MVTFIRNTRYLTVTLHVISFLCGSTNNHMFAASLGLQSINKDKGWRKDPFIYRRVTIDPPGITGLLGAERIKAPIKLELERSRQRSFVYCYWR